ncbi:MAG: prepilin-type N-terminal cleavage/methylation domain-containing protein [Thermoguttaceae bacterium]|nr:prepilin-type N-terminal cleavage/methylation domain-containing protein [Thermoguttaceae bacterium]
MTTNRKRANRGAGFTLVEILVVIVIIGLLAGITSTVLVSARKSARGAVVATQMAQLSMALDEYKNQFGEYPPDFSDPEAVVRHVKKRWPRYNLPGATVQLQYEEFMLHVQHGCKVSSGSIEAPTGLGDLDGQHVWNLQNYISSLVFWLGGLPDYDGKPSGFYANPKAPLGVGYNSADVLVPLALPLKARREAPLFDFELKNIGTYLTVDNGGTRVFYPVEDADELWDASLNAFVYVPAFEQGDLPLVYFRPSPNSPYGAPNGSSSKTFYLADSDDVTNATLTRAVPYARNYDANGNLVWLEEKRFQMIHPGVDGAFGPDENLDGPRDGVPTIAPKDLVYSGDEDNIVNFAEAGTLVSECEE